MALEAAIPRPRRAGFGALLGMLAGVLAMLPSAAEAGRAADFPDPGGDESAPVKLGATAPKLVGANDDFPLSVASHEASVGKLASAGLTAVRRTLSWRSLEPLPGVWDEARFAEAESFYRTALDHSIEPVMILGFAPYWAWDADDLLACPTGKCTKAPGALMDDAWSRFVAEAASRFPQATFEIWNEPNTTEFWGSSPDPERWAELVRIAFGAVKDRSPAARVVVCGCAGITEQYADGAGMSAAEFLRRALAAPESIADHFDAISLHFFPQAYWPFVPFEFGVGSHLAELLTGVRTTLAGAGQSGARLWFDEVGYWTADPGAPQHAVSEQDAATGLAKLVRRLITMADVEAVLVHRAIDAPAGDGSNRYQVRNSTFGLLRRSEALEAKPVFCALAAMSISWNDSDPACPVIGPEPPEPTPEPTPEPEPEPVIAPDPPLASDPPADDHQLDPDATNPIEPEAKRSLPQVISLKRISKNRVRVRARGRGTALSALQLARERRSEAGTWRKWKGSRMTAVLPKGARRMHVRVRDRAGNRSAWVTRSFSLARKARGA